MSQLVPPFTRETAQSEFASYEFDQVLHKTSCREGQGGTGTLEYKEPRKGAYAIPGRLNLPNHVPDCLGLYRGQHLAQPGPVSTWTRRNQAILDQKMAERNALPVSLALAAPKSSSSNSWS